MWAGGKLGLVPLTGTKLSFFPFLWATLKWLDSPLCASSTREHLTRPIFICLAVKRLWNRRSTLTLDEWNRTVLYVRLQARPGIPGIDAP